VYMPTYPPPTMTILVALAMSPCSHYRGPRTW
jgi:hypothetical protein